jgi:nucleoid DNA-binding protein
MTQAQMEACLAARTGMSRLQVKPTLDDFKDFVIRQLKKEASPRPAGLGVFHRRKLEARERRNPAASEPLKAPARTSLQLTPAKALKDSVLSAC